MKTVYDVKEALDEELFVRQIDRWQAERRLREGRRYPDNLIYLSQPWLDEPDIEPQQDNLPFLVKFSLGFVSAVLCLGLIALIAL